jgi:drug/metabolite transporter (DMT)-like permease
MAMFKVVAREQLKLLLIVFLLGSSFRVLPANPDKTTSCGDDLHGRLVLTHNLLGATFVLAAALLLAVNAAEAARKRRPGAFLRAMLLLATIISVAASILAVDGFLLYRTGCDAAAHTWSRGRAVLTCLVGVVHGFFAWVAVSQD